jgi:hypothetical protein
MRTLLATVLALASLVAAAQPASADDQAAVRARLADVAAQVAATDQQVARLEKQIPEREQRIERERAQLRILARALYTQPDSALVVVAQSPNLGAAMTRIGDLMSAADRARATKTALDRDLYSLQSERLAAQTKRADLLLQKADLDAQYARLVEQAAAAEAAAAAARRAAVPAPPPPAPVAPPAASGDMRAIILAAWSPLGPGVANWALRLAQCESNFNPYAVNRYSGAAGLFQFLATTWAGTPWRGQSPFDPNANAQAAAWLYSKYGAGQWACRV